MDVDPFQVLGGFTDELHPVVDRKQGILFGIVLLGLINRLNLDRKLNYNSKNQSEDSSPFSRLVEVRSAETLPRRCLTLALVCRSKRFPTHI